MIDPSTDFGARVTRRLNEEQIVWLTTTGADGTPQPSPVWFLWDGQTVLIYSQPNAPKIRNIERNPRVALNFDGDGEGGDIIIMTGTATLDPQGPAVHEVEPYVEKYRDQIAGFNITPEEFGKAYSAVLRVTPAKIRGH